MSVSVHDGEFDMNIIKCEIINGTIGYLEFDNGTKYIGRLKNNCPSGLGSYIYNISNGPLDRVDYSMIKGYWHKNRLLSGTLDSEVISEQVYMDPYFLKNNKYYLKWYC
jgi:hypothetical protein